MGEMSSGAIHGGPQRIGTAACKEQSFGGLSAVQLLLRNWGRWSFGCATARGNSLKAQHRKQEIGSDPGNLRAYNAVLAFVDSTLRNSSRSPGELYAQVSSRSTLR